MSAVEKFTVCLHIAASKGRDQLSFSPTLKPGRNIHRVPSRFSITQLLLLHVINNFQRHFEVDVLAVGYVVAAGQISDARTR